MKRLKQPLRILPCCLNFGKQAMQRRKRRKKLMKKHWVCLTMQNSKATLNEPEDELPAVLQINSGAGGTESQDWAEMLARMYRMYGEKQGWKVTELDWVWGDGAGIKTCTLQFDGDICLWFSESRKRGASAGSYFSI